MYTIHDYGDMIADRGRTGAYAAALRRAITPTSVVLDLGAGAGIMTLLACQAGAAKVYAVEPDGIIEVARELIEVNGYADRVELIQAVSTDITLPEAVDVIVADIHGALPFFVASPTALFDASRRFLKPAGAMVPAADTIMAAVVSLPEEHRKIAEPWDERGALCAQPGRHRAVNTWRKVRAHPEALLVDPAPWVRIDYTNAASPPAVGRVSWRIDRAADAHGVCLWFDCETGPGCGFSNSPRASELHVYAQGFFPWPAPCRLDAGDTVEIDLRADFVGDDYLWSWRTAIRGPGDTVKASHAQHQFSAIPFSRDWRIKAASAFVPTANRCAAVDKMILDAIVGGTRLDDIAARVAECFPDRFADAHAALTHVGRLSMKYSD